MACVTAMPSCEPAKTLKAAEHPKRVVHCFRAEDKERISSDPHCTDDYQSSVVVVDATQLREVCCTVSGS